MATTKTLQLSDGVNISYIEVENTGLKREFRSYNRGITKKLERVLWIDTDGGFWMKINNRFVPVACDYLAGHECFTHDTSRFIAEVYYDEPLNKSTKAINPETTEAEDWEAEQE